MANERAQVEAVFGLTGGELQDELWRVVILTPEGQMHAGKRRYWYEGVPEYAEVDFKRTPEWSRPHRTVCLPGGMGFSTHETTFIDEQGTWTLVQAYSNSGECECPNKGDTVYTYGNYDEKDLCYLCEEPREEGHGYVYLGEGCAELVYRLDHPFLETLGFTKMDWYAWAGAEGWGDCLPPRIAVVENPDCVVVLSHDGVEVVWMMDGGEDERVFHHCERFVSPQAAIAWAHKTFSQPLKLEDCLSTEFKELR